LLTCPRFCAAAAVARRAKNEHVGRKHFVLPGLQGCPLLHLLSSRATAGGAQKKKKEFFGDTPHPGRDAALPAPSLFRIFETKFGMIHVLLIELFFFI